jgi:hypothetical protein
MTTWRHGLRGNDEGPSSTHAGRCIENHIAHLEIFPSAHAASMHASMDNSAGS